MAKHRWYEIPEDQLRQSQFAPYKWPEEEGYRLTDDEIHDTEEWLRSQDEQIESN